MEPTEEVAAELAEEGIHGGGGKCRLRITESSEVMITASNSIRFRNCTCLVGKYGNSFFMKEK